MTNATGNGLSARHEPAAVRAYGDGYELIRLHAPEARSKDGNPLGKVPKDKGWPRVSPLSIDEAEDHMRAGSNVGVRLRSWDLVLDVDPRNFVQGDNPVARLECALGGLDLTGYPTVKTGGGGRHIYMTKPPGVRLMDEHPSYRGIEFKSAGRQVVAAGSVHPDGGAYRWDDDALAVPLRSVRAAPEKLISLAQRPDATGCAEVGGRSSEELATMLEGLDVLDFQNEVQWRELMMACHNATGGEGRSEWIAWSIGDPKYSDDEAKIGARWDSLRADQTGARITERTLFRALHDANRGDLIPRGEPGDDFAGEPLDDVAAGEADGPLARMNASHFTVLTGGKYLVGRERQNHETGHTEVEWYPDIAIGKHFDKEMVELGEGKVMPIGKWWTSNPNRRRYDAVVFDPTPCGCPPNLYNLWRGWAVEPKPGDWSNLRRLMLDVLCAGDQEQFDYALKWAAFMVQHPEVPAEVALVFKGTKGVGKGTFARALKSLAGKHGKQVAQASHFLGKHNEHLMDAIFLFVDEGVWAGSKKDEGQLKNLITEPELSFEPKGKPVVSGPNRLHIVIASNERWVVPATPDERRFAIFEADTAASKALPTGFFNALNKQLVSGGLAGLLHDLLAIDLTTWHPRQSIPVTKALADQKIQGFRSDPLAFWWHRTLENGHCGLALSDDIWPLGPVDVAPSAKDELLESLNQTSRAMGMRSDFTKKGMAQFLGQLGATTDGKNSKGERVWRLPSLIECRGAFDDWVGNPLDWDGA